jgi:hypothetical protein
MEKNAKKIKNKKFPYFVEDYFVSLDNLESRTIITCNCEIFILMHIKLHVILQYC